MSFESYLGEKDIQKLKKKDQKKFYLVSLGTRKIKQIFYGQSDCKRLPHPPTYQPTPLKMRSHVFWVSQNQNSMEEIGKQFNIYLRSAWL